MGQLSNTCVLVVEDEFLIALELAAIVEDAGGAAVVAASLGEAEACLGEGGPFHAAVLDVRLGKEEVFPVADELTARGTPFVFHSGHARREVLCERYEGVTVLPKPTTASRLLSALASAMGTTVIEAA